MTTNTTNSQAPEILAKQVAEWRKEVARLNDLIAHAEGRDSQAASIADDPEFIKVIQDIIAPYGLNYKSLVTFFDSKLKEARHEAWCEDVNIDALREHNAELESRLAEIQRGVEGAEGYWRNAPHYDEVGSSEPQKEFFLADDIRALLKPQGQADTSGLPG